MGVTDIAAIATVGLSLIIGIIAFGKWQGEVRQKLDILYREKEIQANELKSIHSKYDSMLQLLTSIQISIAKNTGTLETTLKSIQEVVQTHAKYIDELRTRK